MTDDNFLRLMGGEATSKHFAVIFIICIIAVCLLAWSVAGAEECGTSCTGTAWRLEYLGDILAEDMTEEECVAVAEQLEPQTGPFTRMECVEYEIARQDS